MTSSKKVISRSWNLPLAGRPALFIYGKKNDDDDDNGASYMLESDLILYDYLFIITYSFTLMIQPNSGMLWTHRDIKWQSNLTSWIGTGVGGGSVLFSCPWFLFLFFSHFPFLFLVLLFFVSFFVVVVCVFVCFSLCVFFLAGTLTQFSHYIFYSLLI